MRGGARYTHAALVAANLDELAILGQVARHELSGLIAHPAKFECAFDRYVMEACQLAGSTRHHMRLLRGAA